MNDYALFTDVSVNPLLKIGVGGYLLFPEPVLQTSSELTDVSKLEGALVMKRFTDTSSTKLEVETVLWALEDYSNDLPISCTGALRIYSDSQCVTGLFKRRGRLESTGFQRREGARLLRNASLYRKFYAFHDQLGFEVTKVAGHTRSRCRSTVERIFSFLDQKVRKSLKLWVTQLEAERAEWFVYIIRCNDGTLYTGISNDVARRLKAHQEMGKQGAKYLRGRGPLEMVFQKKTGSKSAALSLENKIKSLPKLEKEAIVRRGDV